MAHSTRRRRRHQIETLRAQFARADGLPVAGVLSVHRLDRAGRGGRLVARAVSEDR